MDSKRDPNSDFREYLLYPSKKRHERLANLISKNRNTNENEIVRSSRQQANWQMVDRNQQFLKLMGQREEKQKAKEQLEMRQTKFMHTYMERLKKQRKRQQRRKFSSNPPKQEVSPKKQTTSMYIFLPIVSKNGQSDKRQMGKNVVTTIDLFGDREIYKMKKNRAYSLDEKYQKLVGEQELKSYELKVQQVIQDIKNHRQNKPYKVEIMNAGDYQLFKQPAQSRAPITTKAEQKVEQPEKKDEKKNSRSSRLITFTVKKLEPWIIQPDQMDTHLIPENVGIESFQFS